MITSTALSSTQGSEDYAEKTKQSRQADMLS
jgi:hypothetical protein